MTANRSHSVATTRPDDPVEVPVVWPPDSATALDLDPPSESGFMFVSTSSAGSEPGGASGFVFDADLRPTPGDELSEPAGDELLEPASDELPEAAGDDSTGDAIQPTGTTRPIDGEDPTRRCVICGTRVAHPGDPCPLCGDTELADAAANGDDDRDSTRLDPEQVTTTRSDDAGLEEAVERLRRVRHRRRDE